MPFAQIHMTVGRTEAQKKALIDNVSEAIANSISAPKESIRVCIQEVPKENWGIAGKTAKELGK